MPTVAQVVVPLTNTHDMLRWRIGIVTAVDTVNRKLSVLFTGATNSIGTPRVDYVTSYTPAVGHKVHALSSERSGTIVLGTTGTPPVVPRATPTASAPAAAPDACSDPAGTGTYVQLRGGPASYRPDLVAQGPGFLGVWTMPGLATAIQEARALGLIVSMEIELTMRHGGPRAVLTLVRAGSDPLPAEDVYRSNRLVLGNATRIPLPLGWLTPLAAGVCMIGLSNGDAVPQAGFDADACVYLTVETV